MDINLFIDGKLVNPTIDCYSWVLYTDSDKLHYLIDRYIATSAEHALCLVKYPNDHVKDCTYRAPG